MHVLNWGSKGWDTSVSCQAAVIQLLIVSANSYFHWYFTKLRSVRYNKTNMTSRWGYNHPFTYTSYFEVLFIKFTIIYFMFYSFLLVIQLHSIEVSFNGFWRYILYKVFHPVDHQFAGHVATRCSCVKRWRWSLGDAIVWHIFPLEYDQGWYRLSSCIAAAHHTYVLPITT